ncbi:hypothetical protein [Lentibacillus jeotgali]|uniref:hypothetical protein n=1 Tax=Lentibacillus jeotgali TaxID=558169 RepID=UPI0002626C4F|nr:hypothetical protein [Lentibacillus jeotgali]
MSHSRLLLYTVSGVVVCISFIGMVIYGYKTFFIQTEKVESADYSYHFALITEEADNETVTCSGSRQTCARKPKLPLINPFGAVSLTIQKNI